MEKNEVLKILAEICDDEIVIQRPDLDLFEAGLLDSMSLVELFVRLEKELDLHILLSEVERADLASPEKIISLISRYGVSARRKNAARPD